MWLSVIGEIICCTTFLVKSTIYYFYIFITSVVRVYFKLNLRVYTTLILTIGCCYNKLIISRIVSYCIFINSYIGIILIRERIKEIFFISLFKILLVVELSTLFIIFKIKF